MICANTSPFRCVAIVEPDNDLREVLTLSLRITTMWTVIPAASGCEGIQLARTRQPDVILLGLCARNVITFTRLQIRSQLRSLPIIALVPRLLNGDRIQLAARGFAGAIVLPLDTTTLHEIVADILDWPTSSFGTSPAIANQNPLFNCPSSFVPESPDSNARSERWPPQNAERHLADTYLVQATG